MKASIRHSNFFDRVPCQLSRPDERELTHIEGGEACLAEKEDVPPGNR
jgi:hypothetical protein